MKKNPISPLQCRDTALAVTFLLLLIWLFSGQVWFAYAAMIFLVYAMTLPKTLAPLARLWFGFSHLLGAVMSKVLMGLIFAVIVTPMAVFRKMLGKDSMGMRQWKKSGSSAFVERNHRYTADDLKNLF